MKRSGLLLLGFILFGGPSALAEGGDVEAGRKLYAERNCNACHALAGVSGPMAQLGGSLDDVGSKHDAEWLRTYLTEPKQALPEAKMPKLPFDQKEMADMIAFMMSLKADRQP